MLEDCKSYSEGIRIVFGKNYINNSIKKKFIEYCTDILGIDIVAIIEKNNVKNPTFCINCGKELSNGQEKFCSRSCANSYNNVGVSRHRKYKQHTCPNCGKEITEGNAECCCEKCRIEYHHSEYIKKWKNGEVNGGKGKADISGHVRRYLFEKYNCKCQRCGWGEINEYTGKVPLHIHHIDGNCKNNKEENLELLCPNCHSLTENFGSLNKRGSERRYKWGK